MNVLGIDASLTSTGVALVSTDPYLVNTFIVSSSQSSPETVYSRLERSTGLVDKVFATIDAMEDPVKIDVLAIEGPAFAKNIGKSWDRAGLWWEFVRRARLNGIKVVEVPPTTRAKYATGKGNAGKDEVLLAASRQYPEVDFKTNDEADALIIAAFASRLAGHPIEDSLPANKLDALKPFKDFSWDQ